MRLPQILVWCLPLLEMVSRVVSGGSACCTKVDLSVRVGEPLIGWICSSSIILQGDDGDVPSTVVVPDVDSVTCPSGTLSF